MQHRHLRFRAGDLLQRRLRTTAGEARRGSADRRVGNRIRRVRLDLSRRDQRAGETEPDAGRADREAMIQRDRADGFQIALEHGIGDGGTKTFAGEIGETRADGIRRRAR